MCLTKLLYSKWGGKILWFIGIGLLIGIIFYFIIEESERTTINWITFFGTYSSIYALIITLIQISSLKSVSEQIKEEVENNNKVINQVVLSSEIAKNIRFLREAKTKINQSKYSEAIIRMCDVKDFLTRLDTEILSKIEFASPGFLVTLGIDIGNIEDAIHNRKKIDARLVSDNIEELITSISKCDYKIKNLL